MQAYSSMRKLCSCLGRKNIEKDITNAAPLALNTDRNTGGGLETGRENHNPGCC